MKVSKAIELLKLSIDEETYFCDQDLENAVKLGNEALKLIQQQRSAGYFIPSFNLPGETPENEK